MPEGLSPARIVDVTVSFEPVAVPLVNFDTLLIMGDSDVVDTGEAIRTYNTLESVVGDFGTTAPEYLAADLYFSQQPQPDTLYVGRWARTATAGVLVGGPLPSAEQLIASWNAITDGSFRVTVDGGAASHGYSVGAVLASSEQLMSNWNVVSNGSFHIVIDGDAGHNITALDFTGTFFLDQVAAVVQTALNAAVAGTTCSWDGAAGTFRITSPTTGTGSTISDLTTGGGGTDISGLLKMRAGQGSRHAGVAAGGATSVTGLNFSSDTNLNAVASRINTALTAVATFVWDGQKFVAKSKTTGTASTVGFFSAVSPPSGTDISAKLRLTSDRATRAVTGIGAETPVQGVARVDGRGWYAATFAATVMPNDGQNLAVAAFLEGTATKHLYGITSSDATILDSSTSADLASQLKLGEYERTVIQYSTSSPYAITSFFGRAFTVNFEGSNTTITMKFKKEPLIAPEFLSSSQADTLVAKRCNVYVMYGNGAAILQEGVMSGPAFFDEIHGTDWLANRIQTDVFNLLYQSGKIPQTDPGIHQILTRCEGGLKQSVVNGLVAPGVWNAPGFGMIYNGSFLDLGWYAFAPSVDTQDQTIREQRIAPLIQIAIKMAGAVHFADVSIEVNR